MSKNKYAWQNHMGQKENLFLYYKQNIGKWLKRKDVIAFFEINYTVNISRRISDFVKDNVIKERGTKGHTEHKYNPECEKHVKLVCSPNGNVVKTTPYADIATSEVHKNYTAIRVGKDGFVMDINASTDKDVLEIAKKEMAKYPSDEVYVVRTEKVKQTNVNRVCLIQ